ncbi:MAG: transposase, partial [Deltaproteobacteria bacterium]|nr:transposase [Deltaproteobacteria bacterium]
MIFKYCFIIKELKTQAYGARTSCHTFRANTFRFILSTLCFIIFQELRKKLEGTRLAQAYVSTIRER